MHIHVLHESVNRLCDALYGETMNLYASIVHTPVHASPYWNVLTSCASCVHVYKHTRTMFLLSGFLFVCFNEFYAHNPHIWQRWKLGRKDHLWQGPCMYWVKKPPWMDLKIIGIFYCIAWFENKSVSKKSSQNCKIYVYKICKYLCVSDCY